MQGQNTPTQRRRTPIAIRHLALLCLASLAALAALVPSLAQARTSRPYETSIGSFPIFNKSPQGLAVDQSSGDVYGLEKFGSVFKLHRYTAAGAAQNFSAGPGAGTNVLSVANQSGALALDNSTGPLAGDFYVSIANSTIKAFAPSGAELGAIAGAALPGGQFGQVCSLAVDPADGSLYVHEIPNTSSPPRIWRFTPASPAAPLDDSDYALAGGITLPFTGGSLNENCSLAADDGDVYLASGGQDDFALHRFDAPDFAPDTPTVQGTTIAPYASAVTVDHKTGEVYADRGSSVAVFDESGESLYEFGAAAYFSVSSSGVAVKSAASGPAEKVYVADRGGGAIDVFGLPNQILSYSHEQLGAFGPDGTASTSFPTQGGTGLGRLAFHAADQRLYAVSQATPGIFGFDASAPPAFPPLGAFDPLTTAATGFKNGLAVDDTALASAGNLYLASSQTNLLYGFDDMGAPLPGFPVDPATTPGAPEGSPKDLCGTAVDPSGAVWVANSGSERLLRYSSAGAFLGSVDTSAQGTGPVGGNEPCGLAFDSAANLYTVTSRGLYRYTAASSYTAATQVAAIGDFNLYRYVLAVDPDNDHLFVATTQVCYSSAGNDAPCPFNNWVDEFDAAGNLIDEYPAGAKPTGIAVDPAGDTYLARADQLEALGPRILLPDLRVKAPTALANTTATLNGTLISQGVAVTECRFEYVAESAFLVSGFSDLSSGDSVDCDQAPGSFPLDLDEHPASASIAGLDPDTPYRFRLVAANADGTSSAQGSLTTTAPPRVLTTGAPIRTSSSANLGARIYPVRAATSYHFEYGTDTSYGQSTPVRSAGSGDRWRWAAEAVTGLQPDTTYHYRVVADNGNPDGPQAGEDATFTTRADDEPLSHGDFPGPPGSDRAWEQVSMADTSGNPLSRASGFSDAGDRAVYSISGGTPISTSGSIGSFYFSERPASAHPTSGWTSSLITPPRDQQISPNWSLPQGRSDLSSLVVANGFNGIGPIWRLGSTAPPERILDMPGQNLPCALLGNAGDCYLVSDDARRVIAPLKGSNLDPAYLAAGSVPNYYDVSTGGVPQLVSLLPSSQPPACGVDLPRIGGLAPRSNSVSPDGSRFYFTTPADACSSPSQLYLRDLGVGQTTLISPPPLSGPTCRVRFLKGTADAAFFVTAALLVADDVAPTGCSSANTDVYRYDLEDQTLDCLTCLAPGLAAGVHVNDVDTAVPADSIALAEDGSRLYFTADLPLLPGAPPNAVYRLRVPSGELTVLPGIERIGESDFSQLTPDGRFLAFASDSPNLDPLGGTATNGATEQSYLYDDLTGTVSCVSCPRDGSPPLGPSSVATQHGIDYGKLNRRIVAADGTLAFSTPSPLLSADVNADGGCPVVSGNRPSCTDVYEWRDGRLLLVTDGATRWRLAPAPFGINPTGQDIFFSAAAQLTPDAIDSNTRLYDARIGGGIDFPPASLPPCDLNSGACEGVGTSPPDLPGSGTAAFSGPEDPPAIFPKRCPKGKRRVTRNGRTRCVAKHRKPHHRRAQR